MKTIPVLDSRRHRAVVRLALRDETGKQQRMLGMGSLLARGLAVALGLLAAGAAQSAAAQAPQPELVEDWEPNGLPPDVSMYIYVPDNVADNPPVLTLIHFCGGVASEVFGQANGGGIVAAADQYGFIIVLPSSDRCWDVVSDQTRTRDGGGDSHAIRQIVQHAIDAYGGNADRVYATGNSSGGMMTQLLLALYPDVFKAGAAFAGMPAGCRAADESGSGGGYSGACAGGAVMHTAQEWGDIARGFHPGYMGHRPRVQLFHGEDDDLIGYENHTEAIKQWTDVLDLSTTPTSMANGLSLGDHQATRQTWQNACGYAVLDELTSIDGGHGPPDALFPAQYVIPFLGLDVTGPVDPELEQCDDEPVGGTGGGGAGGTGGSGGAMSGGAGGSSGIGAGGSGGTSGAAGSAGSLSSGGAGGGPGAAGGSATGGSAGDGAGGSFNAGAGGSAPSSGAESSGCTLAGVSSKNETSAGAAVVAMGLALVAAFRRRRRPHS